LPGNTEPSSISSEHTKLKAKLEGYYVPSVDDMSWNFVRQILSGTKGLMKIADDDKIIVPPKYYNKE
jgi:hypothetical protein